jgi:hypothetical protein
MKGDLARLMDAPGGVEYFLSSSLSATGASRKIPFRFLAISPPFLEFIAAIFI